MGVITGHFILVEVPTQVQVGDDIIVTIDFYAINPGAWYWATFLIVDSPGLGYRKMLDKAREIGQEGGRRKTYNLGPMPDKNIALSFFLFAHDDAAYDWSWDEYDIWMEGYLIELTYLGSKYRYVAPVEAPPEPPEPPEEVVLSGIITQVSPTTVDFGEPIDLSIDFNAYCESLYYQIRGWETRLFAELDGLADSDTQWHYGRDGSRTRETLNLGAMPNKNLSGYLVLQGRVAAIPQQSWRELDRRDLLIRVTEAPPVYPCPYCPAFFATQEELIAHIELVHPELPPPPPPPEEKKFPWLPVALIGGGAVVAIVAAKPKKK